MSSYSSADDEFDSDEPPELNLNLAKLMDRASKTLHATCTSAKRLTRGAWHEIFVLEFQQAEAVPSGPLARSGYSCIACLARVKEVPAKGESEIATIRYVKQNTSIPVPEIYYHDLDPENEVGAAFMLMERLPGHDLYKSWDGLSLDHKKVALSEIASAITQLATLCFDEIGCLTEGGIGPVINPCYESPKGPFHSTLNYLQSFISPDSVKSPTLRDLFHEIREELATFMRQNDQLFLKPPFSLIHADFDAQNMLFLEASDGSGPKLTGLIDFEFAHTGPAYFLYEHPIFIQDVSWSKELYTENAILRAHFVHQIFHRLPSSEARKTFIACINSKNFLLNDFQRSFMLMKCSEDTLINSATYYLESLRDGTELAYSGRLDYEPEFYSEYGKPMPAGTSNPVNGAPGEA